MNNTHDKKMEEHIITGCDVCGEDHETEDCPILADNENFNLPTVSRARLTIPVNMMVFDLSTGNTSIITKEQINPKQRFGPFEAKRTTQAVEMKDGFILKVFMKDKGAVWLDTTDENSCNWLCLVRTAISQDDQNMMAVQLGTDIYFITTRLIEPGTELKVWYAPHYARKLGRDPIPDGRTQTLLGHSLVVASPQVVMYVESDHVQGIQDENNPDQPGDVNQHNQDRQDITENLESLGLSWSALQNIVNQSSGTQGDVTHVSIDEQQQGLTSNSSLGLPFIPKLELPRGALVKHREDDQGPRFCGKCNAQFDSLQNLAQHMKEHLRHAVSKEDTGTSSSRKRGRSLSRQGSSISSRRSKRNKPADPFEYIVKVDKDKNSSPSKEEHLRFEIKIVDVYSKHPANDDAETLDLTNVVQSASTSTENTDTRIEIGLESNDQRTDGQASKTYDLKEPKVREGETLEEEESTFNDPDYVPSSKAVVTSPKADVEAEESDVKKDSQHVTQRRYGRRSQIIKNCLLVIGDDKRPVYQCNHCPEQFKKLEVFSRHLEADHKDMTSSTVGNTLSENAEKLVFHQKEKVSQIKKSTVKDIPLQKIQEKISGGDTESNSTPKIKEKINTELTLDNNEEKNDSIPTEINKEPSKDENCNYECGVCKKTFEKLKYLKRHFRGHTNQFRCTACNKNFVRKETLQAHTCENKSSEQDPQSKEVGFACEFCGVTFTKQSYLLRHMATHTGEFTCKSCNRSFSRKESLLQHIKKFHPEDMENEKDSIFPCNQCNRIFSRQVTLVNHMKLHKQTHTCSECGRSFASQFSLDKHTCGCVVKIDGLFVCKICNKSFPTESAGLRHQAIHNGEFTCQICNCAFARKELLNQHLLVCTALMQSQTSGEIVCNLCEKNFADAVSFREHYRDHTHPFKCDKCDVRFLRMINFKKHKCIPVDEEKNAECNICKRKFKNERFLQKHMVVHSEAKYHCTHCNKKFRRIDFFNDHLCLTETGELRRVVRINEKVAGASDTQAICPTCGKSYSSVSNLNKHMLTHGEKKEICEICNKSFHLKISLREHMESVHTDEFKYQCKYCGKFLKCKNSMSNHIKQFHSETTLMYVCDLEHCQKKFRQKGNLKKHMLTHSGNKPFNCRHCPKTFKFPDQRKRHETWHTQGLRFTCEYCYRGFVMQFELRRHIQAAHSSVMYTCSYCFTECRHAHSMKRHLRRRHSDELEWQSDVAGFIRGLIPPHRTKIISNEDHNLQESVEEQEQTLKQEEPASEEPLQEQTTNLGLGDQPFIVAQVSGLNQDEGDITQTVIIQTTGNNLDNEMMSQEVAAALQRLSKQGSLDDGTFAIIQDYPSNTKDDSNIGGQEIGIQEEAVMTDAKQPIYIVTVGNTEQSSEAMPVLNEQISEAHINDQQSI